MRQSAARSSEAPHSGSGSSGPFHPVPMAPPAPMEVDGSAAEPAREEPPSKFSRLEELSLDILERAEEERHCKCACDQHLSVVLGCSTQQGLEPLGFSCKERAAVEMDLM